MQVPTYDQVTPDVTRGLTAALWQQSLQKYASLDPRFGVRICDDFVDRRVASGTGTPVIDGSYSTDREAGNADGTVSFDTQNGPDGVVRVNSTSTTNHGGSTTHRLPAVAVLPTHGSAARGEAVAEFRFDKSDADTIFVGLTEVGDQFLTSTSGLPTDQDYIGFYTDDGGATWSFVTANDNDGGTAVTDSFAIPSSAIQSSGYQKFGFRVNVDRSVEITVNGEYFGKQKNGIVSTALPIETLTPRFSATAGGGTTAPTIDVDKYDVYVAAV